MWKLSESGCALEELHCNGKVFLQLFPKYSFIFISAPDLIFKYLVWKVHYFFSSLMSLEFLVWYFPPVQVRQKLILFSVPRQVKRTCLCCTGYANKVQEFFSGSYSLESIFAWILAWICFISDIFWINDLLHTSHL